ncbi:hypothetical protein BHE18_03430 [Rossellomorea aquimaris]|uniref:Uncharacterized protein n=1 Tax=Rossellomorea aquimaris TaxID=189382 RepID=A0A1J6W540_9BACI|nr:hypothetical protein BHE18_03430 [Rossellomorea aquimaris]
MVSPVSSAVLAAEDASAAVDAEGVSVVAVADVAAAAADADAAVVNLQLEYSEQSDPCMSLCRGLYLYIRDKLSFI